LRGTLIVPRSFLDFNASACERLIRRAFTLDELPPLIEAVVSSENEDDAIRCLLRDDAQTFVDVIDEARSASVRRRSLLIEIEIHAFHRSGAGHARPFAMGPTEMSQVVV
jgi:hypothetical protein